MFTPFVIAGLFCAAFAESPAVLPDVTPPTLVPLRSDIPLESIDYPTSFNAYRVWLKKHPAAEVEGHPEPGYRFLNEMHAELAPLVEDTPHVIRPIEIGRTVKKRRIWGYVLRDPGHPIHARMLVFAQLHPMEWVPAEVAVSFIQDFVANPIPGVEVTVIPVVNVDVRVRVEYDVTHGNDVYRRGNVNHVDLNRDFAVNRDAKAVWRRILPGYFGTTQSALSQPETQAIDKLAAEGQFAIALSLHAMGAFFYTPWAGAWSLPPDHKELIGLARTMQAAQGAYAYKPRTLGRWGFFFRAHGAEIDHLYGKYGSRAVLIEFTRSGMNPLKPKTLKNRFRFYNPPDPDRHIRLGVQALRAAATTLKTPN